MKMKEKKVVIEAASKESLETALQEFTKKHKVKRIVRSEGNKKPFKFDKPIHVFTATIFHEVEVQYD